MAHKSPGNGNKGLHRVSKLVEMLEAANDEASPPPVKPHGLGRKPSGVMTNRTPATPPHGTNQGAQQEVEQGSNVAPRSDTSTEGGKLLGGNGTVAPDIEVTRGNETNNWGVSTVTLTCKDTEETSSGLETANSLLTEGLHRVSKLVEMLEAANDEASPPPVKPHGLGRKPSGVMTNRTPATPPHGTSQGAQQEVEQGSNVAPRNDTSTEGGKLLGGNGTVAPDIEVTRGNETNNWGVSTVTLTCKDTEETSSGLETANSLLTEGDQEECAERTLLRHPTAVLKPNQEVKKRSEDEHVIESVAETTAMEHADDITAQASKRKSLQKQDHVDECTPQPSTSEVATQDPSALLDSGKGDSVHGEPSELDDILPEPIYVDFKQDENIPPTKLQEGFNKLTTSDQKQETFSQWLDKVKDTWKADCPVSFNDASQLNELPGSHLKQLGKAFNEIIVERLGKPPEINIKPGKKPPKDPVYLFLGSTAKEDFIKRLHIACRAFHGVTHDLNAIGILLEEKQLQKKRLRQRLKASIIQFEETLEQLGADVVKLLALDANALKELAMHKVLLDQDKCPIVVAGQVSSGKSSLLNLFISAVGKPELHKATSTGASDGTSTQEAGGDSSVGETGKPFTLPVSTLACTGRVCEISYGCSRTAMVHHVKTGETTEC